MRRSASEFVRDDHVGPRPTFATRTLVRSGPVLWSIIHLPAVAEKTPSKEQDLSRASVLHCPSITEIMKSESISKYRPFPAVDLRDRIWPDRVIESAPIWASVDLRDGNQALPMPMSVEEKLERFDILVDVGCKDRWHDSLM